MTAVPKDPKITELRELFRNLMEFRAVYEATGLEDVETPLGNQWSLWDLEYIYEQSQKLLTLRQRQAISLCLVHNMRERDAAVAMGVSPTNPVMMYATLGIRRLLDMIEAGEFDRFTPSVDADHLYHRRQIALGKLADHIKSRITISDYNCWIYPTLDPYEIPRIRVRSVHASSGFTVVEPLTVMYEAHVGLIPSGFRVAHRRFLENPPLACVNPIHGEQVITESRKALNSYLLNHYQKNGPGHGHRPVRGTRTTGERSG